MTATNYARHIGNPGRKDATGQIIFFSNDATCPIPAHKHEQWAFWEPLHIGRFRGRVIGETGVGT